MTKAELEKSVLTPTIGPSLYPKGYVMQCATKVGSVTYENYVPNGTLASSQQQEIPSEIKFPLRVLPYSGSSIDVAARAGQSIQIPVKIEVDPHYSLIDAQFSVENIPSHVQSWIDPSDSDFLKHLPANQSESNGTIYIYVDSAAKAGSYDLLIDASGSIKNVSGNETDFGQTPIGIMHLFISENATTWIDVGLPDIHRANMCFPEGSGHSCAGFVAYEVYPLTVYGKNQQVTMTVPDLPAGKFLRFIPNQTVAIPSGTKIKMITSGIVTPGAPNALFTPVITIVARNEDGTNASSYIPVAKTENMSIINSPQKIDLLGRFGGNGHSGTGIFGVLYSPQDYTGNPIPVKLSVLGLQNGTKIVSLPTWLSVSIPDSSFDLTPLIPYFFTINFTAVNGSLGTYPVAIGENVGGYNFVGDIQITVYNPPFLGGAIPSVENLHSASNMQSPLTQFKSGIPASKVVCKQGFQLIIKAEDDSPACVKPDTAQILVEKGWAKSTTGVSGLARPPVGLHNLTSSTKPIILGIPFYVKAVVTNYLTEPITYYGGCVSSLSVSFDNIKTTADNVHCLAISKYTLGPNQSVPIQSDKIETIYNATGPNTTTNVQIKFIYEVDGKQASMFTGMQIPIQNAIMIDCSGERVDLHMKQIDKTVNVTKAVALAYRSPEFLSKIKQYGNVSYSGFYNDWFSSESCHTYWNGTEVMFATKDNSTSTRNIQVTEDINQTKVLKVRDFVVTPTK
ncbi:MAG: hypothetical protein KGI27_11315 [Thaumarchaeota archaeon]|nr:hypothetical protein [Nitrososphaerota archaeon]